tara:strand:+ start:50 stop:241 length:192 start_codon:yes stop_codon:yes gene_type:complete
MKSKFTLTFSSLLIFTGLMLILFKVDFFNKNNILSGYNENAAQCDLPILWGYVPYPNAPHHAC